MRYVVKPSNNMLKYIKENFTYDKGKINGPRGTNIGSVFSGGYIRISINIDGEKRFIQRSHIVMYLIDGKWPDRGVKHIDGDNFNDRIENLCLEVDYGGFVVEKRKDGTWRARHQAKKIILRGYETEHAARLGVLAWLKENGDA